MGNHFLRLTTRINALPFAGLAGCKFDVMEFLHLLQDAQGFLRKASN